MNPTAPTATTRVEGHKRWLVLTLGATEVKERAPRHWDKLDNEQRVWHMRKACERLLAKLKRLTARIR